jgi:hypothetical protein
MFPLRDTIPSFTTPYVTWGIIGVNAAVFVYQASLPPAGELAFMGKYALTPYEATAGESVHPQLVEYLIEFRLVLEQHRIRLSPRADWREIRDSPLFADWLYRVYKRRVEEFAGRRLTPVGRWLPFLTCMFLHAGWMHLIGNMWFLYIFGDNVEDALGKLRFVLFYLLTGLAGGALHVLTGPDSPIPTVGASGAISGVMGAYMLMFPHSRVIAIVPLLGFAHLVEIAAPMFLGVWALFQFLSAAMTREALGGGTAWLAHIGGFAAGAAWALLVPKAHAEYSWVDRRRRRPWR